MRVRILKSLFAMVEANGSLAIAWHVFVGVFVIALAAGWRPSRRTVCILATFPLLSVAVVALRAGNPFNAFVFGALAIAVAIAGGGASRDPIAIEHPVLATIFLAFGWTYWHFVEGSFAIVTYGTPLGVIPCPTLALLVGLALLTGVFRHRSFAWIVTIAAAAYGLFGLFVLRVGIDVVLVFGALILAFFAMGELSGARGASQRRARARGSVARGDADGCARRRRADRARDRDARRRADADARAPSLRACGRANASP